MQLARRKFIVDTFVTGTVSSVFNIAFGGLSWNVKEEE